MERVVPIAERHFTKFAEKPKGSRRKDRVLSKLSFEKFADGEVRVTIFQSGEGWGPDTNATFFAKAEDNIWPGDLPDGI